MRIIAGFRNDYGIDLTDPFPPRNSMIFRVVAGNWLDPLGGDGDWFRPPHPRWIINVWVPLWLSYLLLIVSTVVLLAAIVCAPWWAGLLAFAAWLATPGKYIAWRFDKKAGYVGSKVYGVDAPVYKEWLCDPAEVYPGSLAFCQSFRPFATIRD